MENEIQDIIRQLRELTARLEALLPPEEPIAAAEEQEIAEEAVVPEVTTNAIVFTLNDRYRFLRELFGNSTQEMKAAVDAIETLNTEREVIDFVNTLGWDMETREAKDFIAVVTERFKDTPTLLA